MKITGKSALIVVLLIALMGGVSQVFGHCEVPCGIYNDHMRIEMVKEHVSTIQKAMKQITNISAEESSAQNMNQLVRWVSNKESHATEIQHIVTQYFMTQRVKIASDESMAASNAERLAALHEMLVYAMKCKQSTDMSHTEKLLEATDKFSALYFGEEDKKHIDGHRKP